MNKRLIPLHQQDASNRRIFLGNGAKIAGTAALWSLLSESSRSEDKGTVDRSVKDWRAYPIMPLRPSESFTFFSQARRRRWICSIQNR